jgi:hypothetical protein
MRHLDFSTFECTPITYWTLRITLSSQLGSPHLRSPHSPWKSPQGLRHITQLATLNAALFDFKMTTSGRTDWLPFGSNNDHTVISTESSASPLLPADFRHQIVLLRECHPDLLSRCVACPKRLPRRPNRSRNCTSGLQSSCHRRPHAFHSEAAQLIATQSQSRITFSRAIGRPPVSLHVEFRPSHQSNSLSVAVE